MWNYKRMVVAAIVMGAMAFPSTARAQRGRPLIRSPFGVNSTLGFNSLFGSNSSSLNANTPAANQALLFQQINQFKNNERDLANARINLTLGVRPLINFDQFRLFGSTSLSPFAQSTLLNSRFANNSSLAFANLAAAQAYASYAATAPYAFAPGLWSSPNYGPNNLQPYIPTRLREPQAATEIAVHDNVLSPRRITIVVGETLQWRNATRQPQAIVSNDGLFNSGDMRPGSTFRYTFTDTGDYSYHDPNNPLLYGTISVRR